MYKTGWRMWVPPGVMMLSTLLAYIDRQTLAVLSPTILSDTGLSAGAYGEALTYFSIASMIANPLWGSLLDYVGLRAGWAWLGWSCGGESRGLRGSRRKRGEARLNSRGGIYLTGARFWLCPRLGWEDSGSAWFCI